jgi:uncharacterized Zn finger protein (UPF0148 family)
VSDDTTFEPVRACRECGEEYRPGVLVCADCGGEVVVRGNEAKAPAAASEAAEHEAPAALPHPLFVSARAQDVVPMCDRLREHGIEHRLTEERGTADGAPPRYGISVREEDAAAALAAVADLIGLHEGGDVRAVAQGFDPERGYRQCPACGAAPPAGAIECPECGLGLGAPEAAEEHE